MTPGAAAALLENPDAAAMPVFPHGYLGFLLARAAVVVSSDFHAWLATQGVPVTTWRILTAVLDSERTISQLADLVLMKQPAVSRALDRLELDGLVTRRRPKVERRTVRVGLTAKGRDLAARLRAEAQEREGRLATTLPARDIDRLKAGLTALIGRFEAGAAG